MYSKIFNPIENKFVNINSRLGYKILSNYAEKLGIKIRDNYLLRGGSEEEEEEEDKSEAEDNYFEYCGKTQYKQYWGDIREELGELGAPLDLLKDIVVEYYRNNPDIGNHNVLSDFPSIDDYDWESRDDEENNIQLIVKEILRVLHHLKNKSGGSGKKSREASWYVWY